MRSLRQATWQAVAAVAVLLAAGCAAPQRQPQDLMPVDASGTAIDVAAGEAQPGPAPWPPGVHDFSIPVEGYAATGLLAVPDQAPTTLVVVAHGWGGDADLHRGDLEALAGAGALAVAMDYRGPRAAFKVQAGVEDTVAATLHLQQQYPGIDRTLAYGWSMGGEVALLAAMRAPAGTYDYVFSGAGVMDLEAFWHENALARSEVERETGGAPVEGAAPYVERSPALRAGELAGRGVARVFLVHGAADGMVPLEHAERMATALQDAGVPTSYYVVTRDRSAVCGLATCLEVPGPADHLAGRMQIMMPFLQHRIERAADPVEPFLRGTYDADAGTYEPSDTRP